MEEVTTAELKPELKKCVFSQSLNWLSSDIRDTMDIYHYSFLFSFVRFLNLQFVFYLADFLLYIPVLGLILGKDRLLVKKIVITISAEKIMSPETCIFDNRKNKVR